MAWTLTGSGLELARSGEQVLGDGENRVQFGDDKKLLDLVVDLTNGRVAAVLTAFGQDVDQDVESVAVQVFEILHGDDEILDAAVNQSLDFVQQRSRLVFIDKVARHFYNGIIILALNGITEVHGVKVR